MTSKTNKNEKELDFIKSTEDIPSNLKEILPATHSTSKRKLILIEV